MLTFRKRRLPRPPATLRKAPGDAAYRALHRHADRLQPDLRRAVLAAIRRLRDNADARNLLAALEAGVTPVDELRALLEAWAQELDPGIRPIVRELVLAVPEPMAGPPAAQFTGRFDLTNPAAVEAVDTVTRDAVRSMVNMSEDAVVEMIRDGFERGIPPRQLAGRLVNGIGLTPRGARAVGNFASALEEAGFVGLDLERRVERFTNRLLRERANVIARTETIRAGSAGQHRLWQDAVRRGELVPGQQQRRWIVTPDDRLCPICRPMDGQTVGMEEPFTGGDGTQALYPPIHPQCRCAVGLVAA